MLRTSEWVSPGHPDKVCDCISEYILDRYLEKDPKTRFALEVQMKDNFVTLGGEITSEASFTNDEIIGFVKEAVSFVGYSPEYAMKWGASNVPNSARLDVAMMISQQSPDIAEGVDKDGWGDQGIFFGYAEGDETNKFMPMDALLAREIGLSLYDDVRCGKLSAGLDIKTQVTLNGREIMQVVVAIPYTMLHIEAVRLAAITAINNKCLHYINATPKEIIINGTGVFIKHGSIGDCGTTGRKLAVDFYGGNSPVGGGSPWTKDPSKADLTLNAYARQLAVDAVKGNVNADNCTVELSCCIGRPEVYVSCRTGLREWRSDILNAPPSVIVPRLFGKKPNFVKLCMRGLPYAFC